MFVNRLSSAGNGRAGQHDRERAEGDRRNASERAHALHPRGKSLRGRGAVAELIQTGISINWDDSASASAGTNSC